MTIILQIMSRMLIKGYTFPQIEQEFLALCNHEFDVSLLTDDIDFERLSPLQRERFYYSLSKWRSALDITKIRLVA